jgi:hypothetical protein
MMMGGVDGDTKRVGEGWSREERASLVAKFY